MEIRLELHLGLLGSSDSYNFDYSAEAVKAHA
jgi:hypothetical protein